MFFDLLLLDFEFLCTSSLTLFDLLSLFPSAFLLVLKLREDLIYNLLVQCELGFNAFMELVVKRVLPVVELGKRNVILGQCDNFLPEPGL